MKTKCLRILLGIALFTGAAFAQNIRVDGVALTPNALPAPNAQVAVCTQPANTTGALCSPLAHLCSSLTDGVCTQPNPVSADAGGNYHFYIPISDIPYTAQIFGPGVVPYILPDQGTGTSSGGCAGCGLLAGNNTWTGNNFFLNINNVQKCDQYPGATLDAKLNACIAAVKAQGGGIADAQGIIGNQTQIAEVDIGDNSSIPVTLLLSPYLTDTVSMTTANACAFKVFDNSRLIGTGQGTTHNATIVSSGSSNTGALACSNFGAGTGQYTTIQGLLFYNPNGGVFSKGLVYAANNFDTSSYSDLVISNQSGIGLHVEATCCGTVFRNIITDGNSGSGAQPLLIESLNGDLQPVIGTMFFGISADHPGAGLNAIKIRNTYTSALQTSSVSFFGLYSESNTTDTTTPLIAIDSFGRALFSDFTAQLKAAGTSAVAISLTNSGVPAIKPEINLQGFNYQNSGVSFPYTVVADTPTGGNIPTDTNGILSSYQNGWTQSVTQIFPETGVTAAMSNFDVCVGTTSHFIQCSYNNGAFSKLPLVGLANAWTAQQDFSGAGQIIAPIASSYAAAANGEFGYDATNNNWHFWVNGADHLMVPLASGFVSGDCGQPTNSGGTWFIADTLSPCGSGGSGATLKTNGTNNLDQTVQNLVNSSGAGEIDFTNPSGGIINALLHNTTFTINTISCALAGTCTIPHQTGGVNNTSQAGINFITSTVNATGLTATHSNPATNQEKVEITGTVNPTSGGTGQDLHTATGVVQVSGGTFSAGTALANGTTATTQSPGDNTTKLATTAFVAANSIGNPMTTAGDMIVATTSGVPARLPVITDTVPQFISSSNGATTQAPSGIPVNVQSGTTYPVVKTDRGSLIIPGNASPVAVSLPTVGSTGFSSNFNNGYCNSGAGTATITPATGTVNIFTLSGYTPGATSLALSTGQCSFWYSDSSPQWWAIQFGASSGGANTALSNLSSVNINTSLLFQSAQDVGSATKAPQHLWFYGGGTQASDPFEITGTATASRTITFPDNSGTVAELNLAQTWSATQTFGTNISIGNINLGTPTAIVLTNATDLPCGALPAVTGNVTTSAGSCATTVAAVPAAAVPAVTETISTSSPVTVSTTLNAAFYDNQNATAGTAMTFNLPTAAAGKQFCFSNSFNGSAANTGVLTIATSASGQFIIFTDGTLSATGGNVTSGGAAGDAACVRGVDSTHWQLYVQVGSWTKH